MAAAKKAEKAPKKADKAETKTEASAPVATIPSVNGVELSFGNLDKGGTAKSSLTGVIPRKSIQVVKGFNPRHRVEGIEALADTIKRDGLLSSLTVRPGEKEGTFLLVCGERRFRALELLGVDSVPVLIRTDLKGDDLAAKAAAVAENSEDGRTNLNAIELGRVFSQMEKDGWTVTRIAAETATNAATVRRALTLMQAPADVQKKVEAGQMAVAPALELAKLDDKTRAKIQGALTTDSSANDVRKLAKEAAKGEAKTEDVHDGKSAKKKTGAARTASLATWRGQREKQSALVELCHIYHTSPKADQESVEGAEVRGAIVALLWDRGDLTRLTLPAQNSKEAADVKLLKVFNSIIEKEAGKYKVPNEAAAAAG